CRVRFEGETLAETTVSVVDPDVRLTVELPFARNYQEVHRITWRPEWPNLLDVDLTLLRDGEVVDEVTSYTGLRQVGYADGHFLLNNQPYYLRLVLGQGFWPESHLAAPSPAALRREVELIKELGFNGVRVHQKVEDPRFLYWCDRLGLVVWGEMPSPYAYSPRMVERLTREWLEVVRRDRSHPCIVTWVPLNESWGVQRIGQDPAQHHFAQALYHLTKSLDGSRPVISNDGWEHVGSDLLTIHDYEADGAVLAASYHDAASVQSLVDGVGPAGRVLALEPFDGSEPVMLTEFGGVRYAPSETADDRATWGYSTARDAGDFEARLRSLIGATHASTVLSGFCYTQLTDTMQEANGLVDERRVPKLPVDVIREIVTGPTRR
ncbi:MAG: glycoside hydrolase family 2, partial [Actinomycetota bacterium]|nr:glycoside hydrolase family 2 [Actinomycetota bacterium]